MTGAVSDLEPTSSAGAGATPLAEGEALGRSSGVRFGRSLGLLGAAAVVALAGGAEEWMRYQRSMRMFRLSGQVLLFACRLAMPMLVQGLLVKWAADVAAGRARLGRR